MGYSTASRRSSTRRDIPLKADYPRAVDHWIDYFGGAPPTSAPASPVRVEHIGRAPAPAGGAPR
jgi:hypothetical protein